MTQTKLLEGFGAGLVREAALAKRVQGGLERLYRLERVAEVGEYMRAAEDGDREALFVREGEDGALEIALHVPTLDDSGALDPLCQIIEGVSHFVLLTERARAAGKVTQLELELQAEVDKYIVLAASVPKLGERASAGLRARLYDRVQFSHPRGSEQGERYRLANRLAANFTNMLEARYLRRRRFDELRRELRSFFHASREDKLRRAAA